MNEKYSRLNKLIVCEKKNTCTITRSGSSVTFPYKPPVTPQVTSKAMVNRHAQSQVKNLVVTNSGPSSLKQDIFDQNQKYTWCDKAVIVVQNRSARYCTLLQNR